MTLEKTKKRGRPAQLLQMAELHAFVEYLLKKKDRSELQNDVIEILQSEDYDFDQLSEAQQILVRESLKPYREHVKLDLLFQGLSAQYHHSAYERKLMQLLEDYRDNDLRGSDFNILKTMANRYLSFKAHKLQLSDLELYLSQLEKKEAKKKRTAQDHRKFELGGGVLSVYKIKNDESLDTEKLLKQIHKDHFLSINLIKSEIYNKVLELDLPVSERYKLLFEVLNQLTLFQQSIGGIKLLDLAIQNAQKELKNKYLNHK